MNSAPEKWNFVRNRAVRDATSQLPKRITCARRNNQHIQQRLGADGLRAFDGADDGFSADIFNLRAEMLCGAKAGIGAAGVVAHNRVHVVPRLHKLLHLRNDLSKRTKRAAHGKAHSDFIHYSIPLSLRMLRMVSWMISPAEYGATLPGRESAQMVLMPRRFAISKSTPSARTSG